LGFEEPEVAAIPFLIARGGTAVDVGANAGFYTRALAAHCDQVHAFEPNPDVIAPTIRWEHPAVRVHLKALSVRKGSGTLHVPVVGGVSLSGWGSLNPHWVPSAEQVLSRPIDVDYLDSYKLEHVRIIKIDVEGSELNVLQGSVETIARNRPVLLIEVSNASRASVISLVRPMGYRHRELEDITGLPGSPQNVILTPDEYEPPRRPYREYYSPSCL
jgi:FkbM family methyltransferase